MVDKDFLCFKSLGDDISGNTETPTAMGRRWFPIGFSREKLFLKPNAERKTELNWTELDRSIQFSWVQLSFPLCIEPATSCGGRRSLDSEEPTTDIELIGRFTSVSRLWTRGQSNLIKCASRGAHSPVRGHPRGSKFVPLNSWGRGSY